MNTAVKVALALSFAAIFGLVFLLLMAREPKQRVLVNDPCAGEALNLRGKLALRRMDAGKAKTDRLAWERSVVACQFRLAASTARLANLLEANRG